MDQIVYAIGDIHGRADLLADALDLIRADYRGAGKPLVVTLGDYIDRGPQSKQAITLLRQSVDIQFVPLLGNHEDLLLKAIDLQCPDNETLGHIFNWTRNGADTTIASFGGHPDLGLLSAAIHDPRAWQRHIRDLIGDETFSWLRALKPFHVAGRYAFVHAGIEPQQPIDAQSLETLLWTRADDFLGDQMRYPLIVVHGHTIENSEPVTKAARINLDIGVYKRDRLAIGVFVTNTDKTIQHRFLFASVAA